MLCLHWSNVERVTSLWRLNDWRHCVEWHSSMISLLALLSSEVRVNGCHLLGRVVKSDHTVPTALHHAPADVITLIEFWRQYTGDKTARTDRCRWWSGVNVLPIPIPWAEGGGGRTTVVSHVDSQTVILHPEPRHASDCRAACQANCVTPNRILSCQFSGSTTWINYFLNDLCLRSWCC